jgi:DNA-directed RNA polymerase subunit RPC12/RpoP
MMQEIPQDSLAARGQTERTRISCPGCGRNDYVAWPADQPTYHWKCFNCRKEFDLGRGAGH